MEPILSGLQRLFGAAPPPAIGDPVTPTGFASTAAIGSPSVSLSINLSGMGIASTAQCGNPLILDLDPFVTVYINGIKRNLSVELQSGGNRGITRTMRLGGGSKATCSFTLNNKKEALYRPEQGDEVIVHTTNGRFFGGYVDRTSEYNYSGTADLTKINVSCVDYGSLLDRVVVGTEIQTFMGNDPTIIAYQLASRFFAHLGIAYHFTGFPPRGGLGDQIYNWITGSDAMNRLAQDSAGDWRVDFWKTLYLFGPGGYAVAPFAIDQNNRKWREMTVEVDLSRYRNRIYAKSTQDTAPLWTDTFTVATGEVLWLTTAPMRQAPYVLKNGSPQIVVSLDEIGTVDCDFYWINTTLISNPASLPAAGEVLTVSYPSPVSLVAIAEDEDEIAEFGLQEGVVTVPDVSTQEALQAYAEGELERRKVRPTTITFQTDDDGLECGMRLVVDLTRPLVSGDFLITSIQSAEQGKQFFRHTVTAVDSASQMVDSGTFFRNLMASTEAPRDRVRDFLVFQVAETIEGFDNPGLTPGLKQAMRYATGEGLMFSAAIHFNLDPETEVTTKDCIIDVLQNGVSIFKPVEVPDENPLLLLQVVATSEITFPGTHYVFATFTTAEGESGPGPGSDITISIDGRRIGVENIPLGPFGTTGRNLYMTTISDTNFSDAHLVATIDDNTTTTEEINISDDDLLTRAFPRPSKLIWPAGATQIQEKIRFSSDPLSVNPGDVFTLDVLVADSAAHDGSLMLKTLVK